MIKTTVTVQTMGSEIRGFFISFSDKEMADLDRRLKLFDYEATGEGLKKFIMDALCDMENEGDVAASPTDMVIEKVQDYLNKNPEKVMMGLAAVQGLASMLKRKR